MKNKSFVIMYLIYILLGILIVITGTKNAELQPMLTKLFYVYIIFGPILGSYLGKLKRGKNE